MTSLERKDYHRILIDLYASQQNNKVKSSDTAFSDLNLDKLFSTLISESF